jgi:hypothetical protein
MTLPALGKMVGHALNGRAAALVEHVRYDAALIAPRARPSARAASSAEAPT